MSSFWVPKFSAEELDIAKRLRPDLTGYKMCSYRVRWRQHIKLKSLAFARGVTISKLVVEALDRYLES